MSGELKKTCFNYPERKEKKAIVFERNQKTELFKAIGRRINVSQLIGQIYLSHPDCRKQNESHVL